MVLIRFHEGEANGPVADLRSQYQCTLDLNWDLAQKTGLKKHPTGSISGFALFTSSSTARGPRDRLS
jgi:hypothetical protein